MVGNEYMSNTSLTITICILQSTHKVPPEFHIGITGERKFAEDLLETKKNIALKLSYLQYFSPILVVPF